jgi:hypothetical protein
VTLVIGIFCGFKGCSSSPVHPELVEGFPFSLDTDKEKGGLRQRPAGSQPERCGS